MTGLRSEPLNASHDREGFCCGVAALDGYLHRQASQDLKRHVAAVFVMTREEDPRTILGFYTLASYAVETSGLPESIRTKFESQCVSLPMIGPVRSLNLAVSVGVGVYEAYRQIA